MGKVYCLLLILLLVPVYAENKKPNILLIPIDDLNNWLGCLDGHPQAKTPNIDALAKRGVLFTNAQCQSPVCNPSRASMMTSLYPSTTGIYFLNPHLNQTSWKDRVTLPQRYFNEGYEVAGAGKIFHGRDQLYFKTYAGSFGGFGPIPKKKISKFKGVKLWDWGAYPNSDEKMPDYKIANWGIKSLHKKYDKPFFLATGFYRPHVPQYVPKKWLDLYPADSLKLPDIKADDLKDIPQYGINLTRLRHVAPEHEWVVKNNEFKPLVQSYLACVSFVDHQVGKVIEALDNSPYKDNTCIVLYSDHGFHLGEKDRWAKRSLWKDGANVPLIIAGPGIVQGKVCSKPVELIDVYPTLLELTGHQADSKLQGDSLVPLLKDPQADWPHYARTSFGPGNYAIVSERYRYIVYNDGSEEFYDLKKDQHEWNNEIKNPEYIEQVKMHRAQVPKKRHEILGKNSTGHKAYSAAEKQVKK